jgi:hypothetical protein
VRQATKEAAAIAGDENSNNHTATIPASATKAPVSTIAPATKAKKKLQNGFGSAVKPPRPATATNAVASSSTTTPSKARTVRPSSAASPSQQQQYISPAKLAQAHRRLSMERQRAAEAAEAEAAAIAAANAAAEEAQTQQPLPSTVEESEDVAEHDAEDAAAAAAVVSESNGATSAAPSTPSAPVKPLSALDSPPTPDDFSFAVLSDATRRQLEVRGLTSSAAAAATSAAASGARTAVPTTPSAARSLPAHALTVDSPATPELACVQLALQTHAVRQARKNGVALTPAGAAAAIAAAQRKQSLGGGRDSLLIMHNQPRTPGVPITPARNLFPSATPMSTRVRSQMNLAATPSRSVAAAAAAGGLIPPSTPGQSDAPLRFGLLTGAGAGVGSVLDDSLLHDGFSNSSISMSNSLLATPELKGAAATAAAAASQNTATITLLVGMGASSATVNTSTEIVSPGFVEPKSAKKAARAASAALTRAASSSPPGSHKQSSSAKAMRPATASPSPVRRNNATVAAAAAAAVVATPSRSAKKGILKTPKSSVRKSARQSKIPMLNPTAHAAATATLAAAAAAAASVSTAGVSGAEDALPMTPPSVVRDPALHHHVLSATPGSPELLSALSASFVELASPPRSTARPTAAAATPSMLDGPASAVKARRAASAK